MNNLKNKWFYLCTFIVYVFLIIIFALIGIKFIKPTAQSLLFSKITSNYPHNPNIVEVVIDDSTVQKYDWLKDRNNDITADLLNFFYEYSKPAVIGLDIYFPSFRDNMVKDAGKFITQIKKMDKLVSGFVPEQNRSGNDKRFMENFKSNHALNVTFSNLDSKFETNFYGIIDTSDILRESTKNYASVLIEKDKNSNYIFDSIMIVKIGEGFYPSLSLKMYMLMNNTNDVIIEKDFIYIPKTKIKIPYKYKNGAFYSPIRYSKLLQNSSYTHYSISAYKILDTYHALKNGITPQNNPELYNPQNPDFLVDPAIFDNLIVYIGANISGPSDDVLRTPMHDRHAGVDIQASIIDNLLNKNILKILPEWVTAIILLLICFITFLFIMKAKFLKGIFSIVILDLLYFLVVCILGVYGVVLNYSIPVLCQFVTAIFGYTFKFLNENRNKEQIKNAMGKYISKDVMNNVVIKNIENLGLGGKKAVVTVLFSDIRGFTSLSEKMTAQEVSVILNEYFSQMEPIITKYNGVINKFIGDAVMAIFGEPISDINHPQNAVKCAYEMLKKVEYLRQKWLFEGKPNIEIGIGINTGEVFIGNIGTENRMEYTVIGDTVNLASRIEGYNKVYKTNLLVSSSTYKYISDCADVIKIKEVQIRGKSRKMDIYEVLRIDV